MAEVPNFDQVHPEDRSFILGGETFHWQPMWWRDFGEMIEKAVRDVEKEEAELKAAQERGEDPKGPHLVESYEKLIEGIFPYLVPDEVVRFKTLLENPEKRISSLQLNELRDWLREVTNNRPTDQPSPSDAGRGSDARTLQAV
jgi:hypothetical protein